MIQASDCWNLERKQYLPEVMIEISAIESVAKEKGHYGFLSHLYTNYPPKNMNHDLAVLNEGDIDSEKLKKLYKKAKFHYHADKVDTKKHGEKWKVFCECVVVLLNSRSERLK